MDASSIAGASLMMRVGQTQQVLATNIMKQISDQQNQIANLLAQNSRQLSQGGSGSGYSFSTYA